jgi:ABC-type polysaccharide/polyol phosphate transport system ATPase subunit
LAVTRGAGLGVIGPNGAGKTTLLLISRVTWPTSGRVRVAGRVVSRSSSALVFTRSSPAPRTTTWAPNCLTWSPSSGR